jgi:CheY-like chemotaxis protein
MNKEEILIIDDEPQIRKLLEINLESKGYKVIQADNADMGIKLAASHPPDLILLDIGLPDKNGQDVLVDLRTWYNHSIIILSVIDNEENIVKALDINNTRINTASHPANCPLLFIPTPPTFVILDGHPSAPWANFKT